MMYHEGNPDVWKHAQCYNASYNVCGDGPTSITDSAHTKVRNQGGMQRGSRQIESSIKSSLCLALKVVVSI